VQYVKILVTPSRYVKCLCKAAVLAMAIGIILSALAASGASNAQKDVYVLEIEGEVNKATEQIIIRAIDKANDDGAYAFILSFNTPGGRTDSMFNIVERIQTSSVPVLYFVYPQAISASAGTYPAMASHLVGMAPLTTIGAAEPILGYDSTGNLIEAPEKIREYYTAVMRSYAEEHGRDPAIAARFVSENLSLTPDEAVSLGMADVKADDYEDFLNAIDGMSTKGEVQGEVRTLETADVTLVMQELTLRDRIIMAISDPNVAYLLTTVGILGLLFGFMSPGVGIPEVVGVICLSLAFIASGYVDFEYGGIVLIAIGCAFFIVEASTPTFGLYTAGGIIAFIAGSLLLFSGTGDGGSGRFFDEGSIRMFWLNVAVMTIIVGGFLVFGLSAALKLRRTPPTTGVEQMLHEPGIAEGDLTPDGMVRIHGELWKARSKERVLSGTPVEVVAVEGLLLLVEKQKHKGGETSNG
jgi:membrane-bound serine protease (ClpP class)